MKKFIIAVIVVIVAVVAPQGAEGRRWFPPSPAGQQCWRTFHYPAEPQAGYIDENGKVHSFGYAEEVQVCVYVLRHARAE